MPTLSAAVVSIVRRKTSGSTVTSCQPVSGVVTPRSVNQASEMKRPSMKTSPWAKLMSSMMPYTIVYPSAINAKTAPRVRPLIDCWSRTSHHVTAGYRGGPRLRRGPPSRPGGLGGPFRGPPSLQNRFELELAADGAVGFHGLEAGHRVVVDVTVLVE